MLQDIDQAFSKKYEHFLEFGKDSPERVSFYCYAISVLIFGLQDFFEPGVPPELDLSLDRSSTGSMDRVEVSLTADDRFVEQTVNKQTLILQLPQFWGRGGELEGLPNRRRPLQVPSPQSHCWGNWPQRGGRGGGGGRVKEPIATISALSNMPFLDSGLQQHSSFPVLARTDERFQD